MSLMFGLGFGVAGGYLPEGVNRFPERTFYKPSLILALSSIKR